MKLTIANEIKREVAEAVLRESEPSYHGQGCYYAVDTDGDNTLDVVMFKQSTAPWDPWHDNATAIAVGYLVDSNISLDETVDPEFWDDTVSFVEDSILNEVHVLQEGDYE